MATLHFPRVLTRFPVFLPRRAADFQFEGEEVSTPWGRMRRWGAGLTVYDAGTFIGLLSILRDNNFQLHFDSLPAYRINTLLDRPVGGSNLAACRASIRRLLELELSIESKETSRIERSKLLIVENLFSGQTMRMSGALQKVQTNTVYISPRLWKSCNSMGRSAYAFLASQPRRFEIGLEKLESVIGFEGDRKTFSFRLKRQLSKLKKVGWIKNFGIRGTGRNTKQILWVDREKNERKGAEEESRLSESTISTASIASGNQLEKGVSYIDELLKKCESPAEELFLLEFLAERVRRSLSIEAKMDIQPQVQIGPYRVDFLVNGSLVIEIDGRAYHNSDDQVSRDKKRDRYMAGLGFRVFRIEAVELIRSHISPVEDAWDAASRSHPLGEIYKQFHV